MGAQAMELLKLEFLMIRQKHLLTVAPFILQLN